MKPHLYLDRKLRFWMEEVPSHSVPSTPPPPPPHEHAAQGRGSGSFRGHGGPGSGLQSSVLSPGQLFHVDAWELVTIEDSNLPGAASQHVVGFGG